MRKIVIWLLFIFVISCAKIDNNKKITKENLEEHLDFCVKQYQQLSESCPDTLFPRSFADDKLITSGSDWWCSGFFPGTLTYLYEYSKEEWINSEIKNLFTYLEKEKYNSGDHDIGFKINCSFGNMMRITGDTATYKPILVEAAKSLSKRYYSNIGLIKSWESWKKEWQYPVIIDNMMNLELLLKASNLSGNSIFSDIAESHADNTELHHFRSDNSSFHVVSYDTVSGLPTVKQTHQGFSDESAWSRGQAWGLYGYTSMYDLTGKKKYLDRAIKIAEFILNHPNLPEDLIPYWDFDSPDIPNTYRDASAAAIMASALITLSEFSNTKKEKYIKASEAIIMKLSSDEYKNKLGENGNFILKHSVGHLPANSEVDVPLSYADYYYVESLMKLYRKL